MLIWILAGVGAIVAAILVLEFAFPATAARMALGLERRRAGLSLGHIEVEGMRIAYLHGGSGETLVLVHGFAADKDNFLRVARYLTAHFYVVIPDLPGFGDSTRLNDAHYSFEAQTRRLHTILNGMGLTQVHIGGNSMGGAIAALYGALYPDETKSRWLLNPAGVGGSEDSEMAAHFRATGESLLVARERGDVVKIIALASTRTPFLPHSVKFALGERAVADNALHTRVFHEIAFSPPINDTMQTSTVPTLIVWGDEDRVLDPSGAPLLDQALPHSELILLEGVGHIPMLEVPKRAAGDYLDFARALAAPA